IVFHASEPLLLKDLLFDAISKFNNKLLFGLQTNALLLEKKDVAFLKKHRVGIGVSLDSFDDVVNNRQRISVKGDGNFKKAVEAIEWFAGYSGLNVITTITKFNVSHLLELVRFLHARKVRCVLLNPVRATQKGTQVLRPDQIALTKYFIDAVEEAIKLSISSRNRIIIGNFSNIILGIVAPTARRLMCDITPCGGCRCFLTITASGDMIPCGEFIGFRRFYGGNIFDTSIGEAMRSEPFKEIRARIVERIDECDICIFRNICGAPCPAEVYSTDKDMHTLSPYCEFYKELIRYAFKLIVEDKVKCLFRKEAFKNLEYEYKVGAL
ncbi:MAG: peptide-modifying radical SAM enzyme CbpB, partial [Nitrospirota bacterium]